MAHTLEREYAQNMPVPQSTVLEAEELQMPETLQVRKYFCPSLRSTIPEGYTVHSDRQAFQVAWFESLIRKSCVLLALAFCR